MQLTLKNLLNNSNLDYESLESFILQLFNNTFNFTCVPGITSVERISCRGRQADGSYTKMPHSWKEKNLRSSFSVAR